MMRGRMLNPERYWECPNCTVTAKTTTARPATPFHPCRGLAGLSAPMIPAGSRARVTAHDRDDYVGGEMVQVDGYGRPKMNIVTERPDGSNDLVVLAPVARGGAASVDSET